MQNILKEQLIKNARTASKIVGELEIPIILNGGSLLGAYRDNDVIEGDEDDLDFAVPYEIAEHRYLDLVIAFSAEGFKIKRLRPTVVTFERNESHIDFLFYREDPDGRHYYETLYHMRRPFALLVRKEYWDDLSTIAFVGQEFFCPKDVEGFLTQRYMDWENPVSRRDFNFGHFIGTPKLTKWLQ